MRVRSGRSLPGAPRGRSPFLGASVLVAALLVAPLLGKGGPGGTLGIAGPAAPPPAPPESEAAIRVRLGREAAKGGNAKNARHHFLDALAFDPAFFPAWQELAALDAADADAKALWSLGAAFAATDAAGKLSRPVGSSSLAPADLAAPLELAGRRAALARAIADAAGKLAGVGSTIVARWLALLADQTATGASLLGAPARAAAAKALERCRPDALRVRTALEAVLAEARTAGDTERVLEAARLLVGFAAQRRGELGPRAPIAEGFGARHALDDARGALESAATPMTFAELEQLAQSDKKLAFEAAHSTWIHPIVAWSEHRRYRIESVCGLATTLEAAVQVERCHDRLVAWGGADPFVDRTGKILRGVVRLCPTEADLEQEGAPFWWAAGFAAGDVVTVVVHWNNGDDIAQLLAHELTHRFDHATRPGLPAWALEGRANYVGVGTSHARSDALDERRIDVHQLDAAFRKVASDYGKLLELLSGRDPEYRHNYPVGYAMWTFLSQWTGDATGPSGVAAYRDRIPALLAALARSPGEPIKAFEATMCDGADGRATGMKGLAKQLSDFLEGFYREPTPAWAKEWIERSEGIVIGSSGERVPGDHSNQPAARERLDAPTEGDALAALAAAFLERIGRLPDALDAHALADAVDELDPVRFEAALRLEGAAGRKEAAFCRARLLERVRAPDDAAAKPDAGTLVPLLGVAAAYLDALAKSSADAGTASRPRLARALRAEHDRIARLVGRAPLADADAPPPLELAKDETHADPDCLPAVSPFVGGVVEARWSAQNDGEDRGLFGADGPDGLVLGRKAGLAATTGLDRNASWTGAAVHTRDTFVGTYTVRMRVRFETTYVEGRAIVGWTRRDRGVEVIFRAGDKAYGERRSDVDQARPELSIAMSDLRTLDRRLSTMSREASYGDPGGERDSFHLTIHVAGPYVRVQIDGADVLSMRRETGEPVEGCLAFATDFGRATFSDVRVERHRSLGTDARCRCDRFDAPLDLRAPNRFSWTSLVGRRVEGLPPSVHTRLLLWSTGLAGADPTGADSIHDAIDTCRRWLTSCGYPVDVYVAVAGVASPGEPLGLPPSFPSASKLGIAEGNIRIHHGFPGLETDAETMPQSYELGWPAWGGMYIDPKDVIRVRGPIDDAARGVELARFLEGR